MTIAKKGVTITKYGSINQILGVVEPKISLPITVAQSVGATVDSKKIVKAGTPVFGDLTNRETAFVAATQYKAASDNSGTEVPAKATGVILHDVDVTGGDSEASILVFGVVNLSRIDTETQKLLTVKVQEAMNGVFFIKD